MFPIKNLWALFILIFISATLCAADKNINEKNAVSTAEKWLALADGGKYNETWTEAAEYFRKAVTCEQWEHALEAVRKPLGETIYRRLKSAVYKTSLPGAPDGKYFILQFDTSFKNKKTALETVTSMLDKDGKFRISGYYIK